jgi:hypothetical protein
MNRKLLLLPAIAAALLAGCATYGYRNGASGDYYYGQPRTTYRSYGYDAYGGYGYGYPGAYGYGPAWGGYYGGYYVVPRGSWHGGHSGGHGHDGHDGHDGGHHDDGDHGGNRPGQDRPTPPWRDLDRIREERGQSRAGDERPRAYPRVEQAMPARPVVPASVPWTRPEAGRGRNPKRDLGRGLGD